MVRVDTVASMNRGVAFVALMAMLVFPACSSRPTAAPVDDAKVAPSERSAAPVEDSIVAPSERSEERTGKLPTDPDPRAAWIRGVEEACRYGLLMYPSLRLGSRAEVDTMEYGFRELHSSVARVTVPDDPVLREQVSRLMTQGSSVAATWMELALRPPLLFSERHRGQAGSVSVAEKRAATQGTRSFIQGLADLGATACSPLAPTE